MKLEIRAIAGIESADIEIDKIALACGQTGAGKTSIADSARAVLTNDWHMRDTPTKSGLGAIVHGGYDSGKVTLSEGDAYSKMQFPGAEYETAGMVNDRPIWSSEVASGLVNPLALDAKKRAQYFIDLLAALPTDKDVTKAFVDEGFSEQQAGMVLDRVKKQGFDGALAHYAERATILKGQWEEVAGTKWGSKKGEDFVPKGWSETLSTESEQALSGKVAFKKDALEKMIARQAVAADRAAVLKERAAKLEAAKGQQFRLDQETAKLKRKIKEAEDALEALPEPEHKPKTVTCPHCGAESKIEVKSGDYTLTKDYALVDDMENARRTEARDQQIQDVRSLRDEMISQQQMNTQCARMVDDAQAAADELKAMEGDNATTGAASETDINAAREEVTQAEERLRLFIQKQKADVAHKSIMMNLNAVEILKPEGLRKRKLTTALEEFNKKALAPLGAKMDGVRCFFDENLQGMMETARGIRSYRLLSRGEKLIFQAMLQFAVAEKDHSTMVIIDDADAITGANRANLVKMAAAAECRSLICIAVREPSQVPDLTKWKLGRTYWIANRTATPVDEMKEAAA